MLIQVQSQEKVLQIQLSVTEVATQVEQRFTVGEVTRSTKFAAQQPQSTL